MDIARQAVAVAAILAAAVAYGEGAELDRDFEQGSLVIQTADACWSFQVYLALSPDQQQRGLMHVRHLPKFTGMLFVYGDDERRSMWMKNTLLPLDMLFIRGDGSIESIVADTEPMSLRSISSGEPVRYVLELNAGVAAELGIDTASTVHFP